ncbi:hypothetical protein HDIA_0501 [Hartmannibacter diazotrophicus]|uniref:Uncharacterized protein n=1 Tax=Hartmannibacter diazotrophicus TaxID=1482074 RepID=A0A2C9D145_9HYPH|nr:hypothetical protein HDIA_0501 [Hartmannibacter diazotrophicus]
MDDPPPAVCGFKAEAQPPIGRAVEANAKAGEALDRGGGRFHDPSCSLGIAKTIAGGERVGEVRCRFVIVAKTCGKPALCPDARRLRAERRFRQKDHRLRREMQRREQPGDTATDNDRPASQIADVGVHIASIRSTASRARPATSGAIVTSWRFCSNAARMLARVTRFMCGHRLQGRMNSISG